MSIKLGIGATIAQKVGNVTKLPLPDDVKTGKVLRLSSSANNHVLETEKQFFVWGMNENARFSGNFFTDQSIIKNPTPMTKTVTFTSALGLDYDYSYHTLNSMIINMGSFMLFFVFLFNT